MPYCPPVVRIKVERPEQTEDWYSAVVRDHDNGMLVCAGPLKVIHGWLQRNGYRYLPATDGLWRKEP